MRRKTQIRAWFILNVLFNPFVIDSLNVQLPPTPPTSRPTPFPTNVPTGSPTLYPTMSPTLAPTNSPSFEIASFSTLAPTQNPTLSPTELDTMSPTLNPTLLPSTSPTLNPTDGPTKSPTTNPTRSPISSPSASPTQEPTFIPTNTITVTPINLPTEHPSSQPSKTPTSSPVTVTNAPLTEKPSMTPTSFQFPTEAPTFDGELLPKGSVSNSFGDEWKLLLSGLAICILLMGLCSMFYIVCKKRKDAKPKRLEFIKQNPHFGINYLDSGESQRLNLDVPVPPSKPPLPPRKRKIARHRSRPNSKNIEVAAFSGDLPGIDHYIERNERVGPSQWGGVSAIQKVDSGGTVEF